jgi:hypothetical protein
VEHGADRFQLELNTNRNPIEGVLRDEQGETVAFTGWLELITLLERTRRGRQPATTARATQRRRDVNEEVGP